MTWRRWVSFGFALLSISLATKPVSAQLATANGHDGGNAVARGFAGLSNSGAYSAAIPLNLPSERAGLPIPVQITYSEHGVGAAGLRWDVPLSFIRRDVTFAGRRPVGIPNVAPQPREQVVLMLDGRRMDLIRTSTAWVPRSDASDIRARENSDGSWVVFDGHGRSYHFAVVAPALSGTNLWLLQDIHGPGNSNVHLEYTVTTPAIPGGTGLSIDLATVRLNPSPSTAGCFKNSVDLAYDASGAPLSVSFLGAVPLVRNRKLITVDVTSRESCTGEPVRLRQYQFTYSTDPDTRQPLLQSVQVLGRAGTPEATTAIPIATYTYGAASSAGTLAYLLTQPMGVAFLGQTNSSVPALSGFGAGSSTNQMLIDVTGDARPDVVTFSSNSLSVQRNIFGLNEAGLAPGTQLSDTTMSPRPIETRTASVPHRGSTTPEYQRVWRQAIDVNGDGRVDIIDAAEQAGRWVIYLNTPDPVQPTTVRWQRRSYSITTLAAQLTARGLSPESGFLPLARTASVHHGLVATCWEYFANGPKPIDGGFWALAESPPLGCTPSLPSLPNTTITEWQVKDINGDSYPDVVFNSSKVRVNVGVVSDDRAPLAGNGTFAALVESYIPALDGTNRIEAAFNILGTRLTDGNDEPFSVPVTLRSGDPCGVVQSTPDGQDAEHVQCDVTDVNGDGLVDRVAGSSVWLGTGALDGSGFFMPGSMLTLPGPLAATTTDQTTICNAPGAFGNTTFTTQTTAQLSDVTGDGIPDYLRRGGAGEWSVAIGTGLGFAAAIPVTTSTGGPPNGAFSLSVAQVTCDGTTLTRKAGLLDINGDHKPDVVSTQGEVYVLFGPTSLGGLNAGRLIALDNGFGARTTIQYSSIKNGLTGMHQVPFPEIVVDSVTTTGTRGLGGDVSTTRYAYSGAELVFDPAYDAFVFPGYRRQIAVQDPVAQPAGVGTVTITDTYTPTSAVNPYDLAQSSAIAAKERYRLRRLVGRVRDVTVLAGDFGSSSGIPRLATPSALLSIDINSDPRRIAGAHHEWDVQLLASSSDPPGQEPCSEMLFPYDHAASATFDQSHDRFDACTAHGFAFLASTDSWRGNPGAAPPSTGNVETRSEVREIDDLGRVRVFALLNDTHRSNDDLCLFTTYAAPTGTDEQQLHSVTTQTVTDCTSGASSTLAVEHSEYDGLPAGNISQGFRTAHSMERRDDSGALMSTIRRFDAVFDALGNLTSVTTRREDGAVRTATSTFDDTDPFRLAPRSITTTATGVPVMQVTFTRDPLTLEVLSTTDPNGTGRSVTLDGFDRVVQSQQTPPGGVTGTLSFTSYHGFSGSDAQGRRITHKVFTDPVSPQTAVSTPGRTATVYLDELGRQRRTDISLGADYASEKLIVGDRRYDGHGRVVFEADAYPSAQSFDTAYGTTRFFNADGTLRYVVRASGQQQPTFVGQQQIITTDESNEIFPTFFGRTFQNSTEIVSVQDAASLLAGSPQHGVVQRSELTAINRLLSRSTWSGATRLEHATFGHDRLGHLTSMTRFQDANAGARPVTSSWRHDSLGQLLEVREPDSSPQFYAYSNWGELLEAHHAVLRSPPQSENGPPPPDTDPVTTTLRTINTYDSLGRMIHSEQQTQGVVDPETVNSYVYDVGVNEASQVTPTNVLGRLARATSPTSSVSFSYDSFGRINARVFTDQDGVYVEKHELHGDGALDKLHLFLPDTAYTSENIDYTYDSAGRGRSVRYDLNGSSEQDLFAAQVVDPFGRLRQGQYGQAGYAASYAELGRRLMNQVTVSSSFGSRAITYQGFDPVGRERSRVEARDGNATTSSFAYDALGRLSSLVKTTGTTAVLQQQFTYDPLGNLLTLTSAVPGQGPAVTTLSYLDTDRDRICRIAYGADSDTTCNVTYDEIGNIVTQATATGQREYSYLIDGSVRTISDERGTSAHFRYDAFGEVQQLQLTSTVSTDTRDDRHYGGLMSRRDEGAGSARGPVYLRKIPGPHGLVATRHGAAGPWTFTFGEHRGNRFFTDQAGAFVQDVDYQAYGKASSTGAEPGTTHHSSEQWNFGDALAAFGISQLGARLYDPVIGRFLSRDPLLILDTATRSNPYAFASNDPVNSADPSGLHEDPRDVIIISEDGNGAPKGPPTAPPSSPPSGGTSTGGTPAGGAPPGGAPPSGTPQPPPSAEPPIPPLPTDPSQPPESGPGGINGPGLGGGGGGIVVGPPGNTAQARALLGMPGPGGPWAARGRAIAASEALDRAGDVAKEVVIEIALDSIPIYGAVRGCMNGPWWGCAIGVASSVFVVLKSVKVIRKVRLLSKAKRSAEAIDRVVDASGGSLRKAVDAANRAGLSQSEAIEAFTRVVTVSGRKVGAVLDVDGAKVLTGVRSGAGQPIVHISANGTARFGHADTTLTLDAAGELVGAISNLVLP